MSEPSFEFIAERLAQLQAEQAKLHHEMREMRDDMANVKDGITVLTGITLRIDGTVSRQFRAMEQIVSKLAEPVGRLEPH
jgi:hypothetical protein